MSYCRWSSNNFQCDIYAYESCYGGYEIHIAGLRVMGDIPKLPQLAKDNVTEFSEAHKKQMAFLETATRKEIVLPYANESFHCETLEDFEIRLRELKELGYNFPDYVFTDIEEEKKERV